MQTGRCDGASGGRAVPVVVAARFTIPAERLARAPSADRLRWHRAWVTGYPETIRAPNIVSGLPANQEQS